MSLIVRKSDFPICPEGIYQAVCYAVFDLGTQECFYMGHQRNRRQVAICWETKIENLWVENGSKEGLRLAETRFTLTKIYTKSVHPRSQLMKDLQSWRGRLYTAEEINQGIKLDNLLGHNCQLQIVHKVIGERNYPRITAVMPFFGEKPLLKPTRNPVVYVIGGIIPDGTPEWLEKKIYKSKELSESFEGFDEEDKEVPPPDVADGGFSPPDMGGEE